MLERMLITLGLALLGLCVFVAFRRDHLRRASQATVAIGKPAILYFRSDACVPCSTQGRFLQQLQAEFGDRIVVEKVDADVEQAKAERYGVFTLPTTLIVDPKGTVRHANYGLADTRKLASQLRAVELVALS
jgi:thiol-disulfide isomerase/thioredoxin